MRKLVPAVMVVTALAAGCNQENPIRIRHLEPITVQGEIQAGVECPMLKVAANRFYSLGGDLSGFKAGDKVCVRGRLAEVSYCMAGEGTIAVEAIGPAGDCPK